MSEQHPSMVFEFYIYDSADHTIRLQISGVISSGEIVEQVQDFAQMLDHVIGEVEEIGTRNLLFGFMTDVNQGTNLIQMLVPNELLKVDDAIIEFLKKKMATDVAAKLGEIGSHFVHMTEEAISGIEIVNQTRQQTNPNRMKPDISPFDIRMN